MLIYCHWQTILQMSIETTYSGNHVQQGCTHLQQSLALLKATLLCVLLQIELLVQNDCSLFSLESYTICEPAIGLIYFCYMYNVC